jgi:MFS family permease
MARVSTTYDVDDAGLAEVLSPRDDTVAEAVIDDRTFGLDHGPFDEYERSVEVVPLGGGQHRVHETTTFRLAIPYFAPLFTGLYKHALKRSSGTRGHYPWWAPPDRLDARSSRVLALLCMLSIITGYLGSLISQTLTFAADEFDVGTDSQGEVLAAVRLGAVLTLGIIALADRRGRRIVLVVGSIVGCVTAALGALAPNLFLLGTTQTFSRACALAVGVLVLIVAAEEMPAGSRAYAVSVTTMTGALGAGMVLWMLPLADLSDTAWRAIYLVPLLGLLPILHVGRLLPETRRFEARAAMLEAQRADDTAGAEGIGGVEHPGAAGGGVTSAGGRFWLLAASAFLGTVLFAPASQFQNEFLREEHGFSAGAITLYVILSNLPGGIGIVVGGRLADTYGRRRVGALALFGGAIFTTMRFLGDSWMLWVGGLLGSLIGAAAVPTLGVYGPELFPTDRRGSANGGITLFGVLGSVVSLLVVGQLADRWGGLGEPIALMTLGPLLLAILIWVAYPETARLELEELNPEDRELRTHLDGGE